MGHVVNTFTYIGQGTQSKSTAYGCKALAGAIKELLNLTNINYTEVVRQDFNEESTTFNYEVDLFLNGSGTSIYIESSTTWAHIGRRQYSLPSDTLLTGNNSNQEWTSWLPGNVAGSEYTTNISACYGPNYIHIGLTNSSGEYACKIHIIKLTSLENEGSYVVASVAGSSDPCKYGLGSTASYYGSTEDNSGYRQTSFYKEDFSCNRTDDKILLIPAISNDGKYTCEGMYQVVNNGPITFAAGSDGKTYAIFRYLAFEI